MMEVGMNAKMMAVLALSAILCGTLFCGCHLLAAGESADRKAPRREGRRGGREVLRQEQKHQARERRRIADAMPRRGGQEREEQPDKKIKHPRY